MYSHEQSYAILYQHSQQLQWLLQFGCQCCSSSQFLNLTYFCCCCWPVTRASVFMFFASPHNWVLYARVFFAYFPVFSLVLHTIIRENSTVDSVCWAPCFFFFSHLFLAYALFLSIHTVVSCLASFFYTARVFLQFIFSVWEVYLFSFLSHGFFFSLSLVCHSCLLCFFMFYMCNIDTYFLVCISMYIGSLMQSRISHMIMFSNWIINGNSKWRNALGGDLLPSIV